MDITSDLPEDERTLSPYFALNDPLTMLQVMLNERNIDVENLDERVDNHGLVSLKGYRRDHEQAAMEASIQRNPKQRITSQAVRDLNDRYHKTLANDNPQFIFSSDLKTGNNVHLLQESNQSFAKSRDMFVIPPPKDVQSRILDLLQQ